MTDFRAGTPGTDVVEPLHARTCGSGGADFDHITALKFCTQRYKDIIDFTGDRLIADIRMDIIGKVNGTGPAGQRDDFTFRGKDVDRIREKIDLDVFEKLAGIPSLALDIQQGLQPAVCVFLEIVELGVLVLV